MMCRAKIRNYNKTLNYNEKEYIQLEESVDSTLP